MTGLAARCAHELADAAAVRDLLALLDSYQPGYLAPCAASPCWTGPRP